MMAGRTPVTATSISPTLTAMPSQMACRAILTVRWAMAMLVATRLRSSSMMTTSADSLAAVDPRAPIAIPTSAAARTGASLTPSPTMATGRSGREATWVTLSAGSSPALTSATPSCRPTWRAVTAASPVSIATSRTPSRCRACSVAVALSRTC